VERSGEDSLREATPALFSFRITDATTQETQIKLSPAAWIVPGTPGVATDEKACTKRAQSLISGHLFNRATVDFNVYYVLTLHDDSIAAYDPLFGFGGTKLLAQVALGGRGGDWRISLDETRLFVSVPEGRRLHVIDTKSWETIGKLDIEWPTGEIALQPDGHYVWVADGDDPPGGEPSGVTAIDSAQLRVTARIPTGHGRHAIAFSDDSRHAFVTNLASGTVSIIDTRSLIKIADCPTGRGPIALDFSGPAGWAYVAHEGDGGVVAVDGRSKKIAGRLPLAPGLTQVRFAPGGRYGFVVNPAHRELVIFEAANLRVLQRATFATEPRHVSFSESMAYVLHRDSPSVSAILLNRVGDEGRPLSVSELPMGRNPLMDDRLATSAEALVPAPTSGAVLLAHPTDRAVYYYREGMNAPMGTFKVSTGQPWAVLALDRSLRERSAAGEYETVVKLPEPGAYDVVFVLDSPRVVHCFPLAVEADPVLARARTEGKIRFDWIGPTRNLHVGRRQMLKFRLLEAADGSPRTSLAKVRVAAILSPGTWQDSIEAAHVGDGVFQLEMTPPRQGAYYLYIRDPEAPLFGPARPLQILYVAQ
jgi:YVTN family beta-propeller protein